jgi:hypothetical protein
MMLIFSFPFIAKSFKQVFKRKFHVHIDDYMLHLYAYSLWDFFV